jgi:ATP-dependent helicase/DNAse subunit B
VSIGPGDSEDLDAIARWGRVIGGLSQWTEAFDILASRPGGGHNGSLSDSERALPAALPVGVQAAALKGKFGRFLQRITPPARGTYREFTSWLEAIIGADPDLQRSRYPITPEPTSLQVVAQARTAPPSLAERDVAALQALKDVLRGLVWTEDVLDLGQTMTFTAFFEELAGAIEAATFHIPPSQDRSEILVANVRQANGVPFQAVALLGLAEGEFPAVLGEDHFLRDSDREQMRAQGITLEPSLHSVETEAFYQAVTRPRQRLLLTRPRLAENGAEWPASPFWEEILGLVGTKPLSLTSETRLLPPEVASWPEVMETIASYPDLDALLNWASQTAPERIAGLRSAGQIVALRHASATGSRYNGVFAEPAAIAARYGPDHVWSSTRLEAYRRCPFSFFVGSVLGLEPRQVPAEGLDAAQLGNIYHHIFENLYQNPQVGDPADLGQLLAALPQVAASVLEEAPQREGFRRTVWWAQTRAEIESNVALSLHALAELPGDFVPYKHEAVFGLAGQPCLVISAAGDQFRLRGYIDRIDRAPDGRLRVIDYKTGGPSPFSKISNARWPSDSASA